MQLNITTDKIILIVRIIGSFFLACGFFFLGAEIFEISPISKTLAIRGLTNKVSGGNNILEDLIDFLSQKVKKIIKINDFKRKRLVYQFEQLNIKMTPEEYYARIAVKTGLATILVILSFFVHAIVGIFALLFDILFFLLQYNEIDKIIQKKKEDIEYELPKFVSVIEQTFKNDHDVIKLITTYVENGNSPFTKELNMTLADMKTGDFDTALSRLATRVDSVYLSETVRGLKSALRGENTIEYFKALNTKLWNHEKAVIKKKALKTPSKVKFLTKALLVCMFLIYIVVFGTVIYENLYEIFAMM